MHTKRFTSLLRFFCCLLVFSIGSIVSAQQMQDINSLEKKEEKKTEKDTLTDKKSSENSGGDFLKDKVDYKARDSMVMDETTKRLKLYNDAEVIYGDVKLNAGYIEIDYENGVAYSRYILDSLGNKTQKPIFKQADKSFDAYALTYNFNSGQGYIRNVKTEEQEGYAVGRNVKKVNEEVFFASDFYFSTDEALRGWIDNTGEETDYFIRSSRVKMTSGKNMVSGFTQLYIADIPTPLFLPFTFLPLSMEPTSGVLIPSYNITKDQGFGLVNGGYYIAFNEYLHGQITGDIYTKGSWAVRTMLNYIWKYHFTGSLGFNYSQVVYGEIGLSNYSKSRPWQLSWSHTQDPKFVPDLQLSASVNVSSSGYYQNSLDQIYTNNYINNSVTSSSINLNKRFGASPFTLSINVSQSQNNATNKMSLVLPTLNFNVNRIYPFKKADSAGKKWYEKINFSYAMNFQNRFNELPTELFFKPGMWEYAKNGLSNSIPISTNYTLFKYINLGLNFNYTSNWYFKSQVKQWNQQLQQIDIKDGGFRILRQFNTGASLSTVVYGMYTFNPKADLKAIRHILTPSLSYNFRPDFSTDFWGYFYAVQTGDRLGAIQHYSYFENGLASPPSWNSMQQSMSFSLNNNFEAKVQDREDSTKTKKVKLLDQLQTSISYNFAATQFRLSDIPVSGGTTIIKDKVRVNFRFNFSPYKIDENYQRIDEYTLPRMTQAGADLQFSLSEKDFIKAPKKDEKKSDKPKVSDFDGTYGEEGYFDYEPSWSLNFGYVYSISKLSKTPQEVNSLTLSGNINFTKNWSVSFNTGYDFKANKMNELRFNFARQLNTWHMTLSWVPISYYSSYSFFIGVKAGILKDLKYDQNNNYRSSIF